MKCDICDYSTDSIASLLHYKKIQYTPQKPFDCTKCGKGVRNKFHLQQHYQTPAKTKWKLFNALLVENVFRKSKIIGSIMIISIKTLKGSLVNHMVKSLRISAHWVFFILKSNTLNQGLILICPFRNGVVRYARNHIPIQEHYRTLKVGS